MTLVASAPAQGATTALNFAQPGQESALDFTLPGVDSALTFARKAGG